MSTSTLIVYTAKNLEVVMLGLLLLLCACRFEAASKVSGADTAADDSGGGSGGGSGGSEGGGSEGGSEGGGSEGGGSEGGGSGGGDDSAAPDPDDVDDDGDGYTENDGDCDDSDPGLNPGATDICDGVDNNCDDEVDEDAGQEDPDEPDRYGTDLGTLAEGEVISGSGTLYSDEDSDLYLFDFEDSSWGSFTLSARLSGIPDGAVYRMTLENATTGVTIGQDEGEDTVSITYDDAFAYEDGGDWEITVDAVSGADCERSYLVSVSLE